ncbi:ATG11 [Sanghuangporus sanghuang]
MLRVCRAEDGEVFQVDTTLWEIERDGSLEHFLQNETGVHQDAVLAYLSDGRRLTNENIRDLAGAQDDTIYVFNKFYLDYDLHEVLRELRAQPHLQPQIEDTVSLTPPFRPHQLAKSYLHNAHVHHDYVVHTVNTIRQQNTALSIASRSLDLNILALSEAFDPFAQNAQQTLTKQRQLLAALDTDLVVISAVHIHPAFLGDKARKAAEAGEATRTLGSYVDRKKMSNVAEGCSKLNDSLTLRFDQTQEYMDRLNEGAYQIRTTLQTNRILESAESSERHAQDAFEKISDIVSRIDTTNSDQLLPELKHTDGLLRKEVESITDTKNLSTELCIGALRRISVLNADLVQLPHLMGALQAEFRAKSSFTHIQRLHNMTYCYGATIIEIVRRKEFSRFFYQRAQTILEVMAKLTSAERRRRQIYRGEVHDQLPFEVRGLDDSVPTIDFSPSGGKDNDADPFPLERAEVEAFMQLLDELDRKLLTDPRTSAHSLKETRTALVKLIDRMDSIESSFEKVVERSLLSSSRMSLSRRRLTEADEAAFHELSERVAALEKEKLEREDVFSKEREQYQAEISRLKEEVKGSSESSQHEREHIEALKREVHSLKAQNESESIARKVLEQRHSELLADVGTLRKGQADALAEGTSRAQEAETLRLELSRMREEHEEVKTLEATHAKRVAQLLADQTETLRSLAEARGRGEDLRAQIDAARSENAAANRALQEVNEQKERLLRAQALEHDRIMRDHIAEADGDRAVLEQRFFETRAQLDENERQLKQAHAEMELLNADAVGLREELQRTEHELREARHVERVLRNDLSEGRASQSDYEQKIADRDRLVAQILDVAIAFRDCHAKALVTLQPLSVHPATAMKNGINPSESVVLSPPRLPMSPLREDATPIDPTDPAAALEILRSYDLDSFSETVSKVGSVMRKWQKQCREYRERAKGKITFRNFAKGDLALFLPTRNSVSKPWAAFNVSFPHYFLNATGRLAEQLRTREWIVARITSISEKIVDARDPSTNPYGLGDGIKYYMLEVEDWTRPGADGAKRRKSSAKQSQGQLSSSPPLERPISPPLDEVAQNASSAAEPLSATRSPNSHLFPVRSRSNSASAGPSSLSRLLAQAGPTETTLETIPATPPTESRSRTPPAARRANGPPSASSSRVVTNVAHSPPVPSPLRPGSRASSQSTRISFSGGRLAPFPKGGVAGSLSKAAATTALSSENPAGSPPTTSASSGGIPGSFDRHERHATSPIEESTPSPAQSVSEGMSNVLWNRRRTASEHVTSPTLVKISKRSPTNSAITPKAGTTTATSALASLLSLGRRRKATVDPDTSLQTGQEQSTDSTVLNVDPDSTAPSPPANENSAGVVPPTPASKLTKKIDGQ